MNKIITRILSRAVIKMIVRYGVMSLVFLLAISTVRAQSMYHLSLNKAMELGLKNSKQLNQLRLKVEMELERQKETKRIIDPKMSLGASFSQWGATPQVSLPIGGTTYNSNFWLFSLPMVSADATQLLYQGNKLKNVIESGELLKKATLLDANKDSLEICFNILNAYYNLHKLNVLRALIHENLIVSEKRLEEVKSLERNGVVTHNDVLKVDLNVSNIKLGILDAENNLNVANYNMNIMLGLSDSTTLILDTVGIDKTYSLYASDYYFKKALQNRQELKAFGLRINAAEKNVQAAKADYYPSLVLMGKAMYSAPNLNFDKTLNIPSGTFVNIGLGLSYNINSVYMAKHKVSQAKLQVSQSKVAEIQMLDNVKMEINKEYMAYQQHLQRMKIMERNIAVAEENYRIVKNKYANQMALLNDLLEADNSLLVAKINHKLAQIEAHVIYARLQKSIGVIQEF